MKDGRAGHSGLTERPSLNELKVIVAEGAEKGSKMIVYSSEAERVEMAPALTGNQANLSVLPMMRRLCHPHLCRWLGECLSLWVACVCRFRGP
jgi:hypothetical protein